MRARQMVVVASVVLLGCATEADDEDAAGGAAATVGSGGAGGSSFIPFPDPCEEHADRSSCCADVACSWHENFFEVSKCVDRDRICEVAGEVVRQCPDTMVCHDEEGWTTEDDCAELPPGGVINLLGRGVCVWPETL